MSIRSSRPLPPRPRLTAAVTAALLLVPAAAAAATGSTADAGPTEEGAPGIGDPYFPDYGNGGYNVKHYDVDVSVDGGDTVSGTTTLTAKAKARLSQFNLDFVLDVTSVKVNGETATFTKPSTHELVVTPATPVPAGSTMTIKVVYSDKPGEVFDRGINPVYRTGNNGLLILGEPESAAWWIPSNDHPRDKATYDIAITVPNGVEGLSSGKLMGMQDKLAGDVWRWKVGQPATGYLLFLAASQYVVTEGTVDGRPSVTAIETGTGEQGEAAAADFARMDEIVPFLESQFGKYRFNVHGNVMPFASVGFALETQTRPVYSPAFWFGGSNVSVVVHEQAHQWWGDNVSVHNWRDVWLNEGFATWSQWRWEEDQGTATANEIFRSVYDSHPASDSWWNFEIGDPGASGLFAGQVYDRGAMTVQGLRNRIGEADVHTVFERWHEKYAHDDASIRKFIKLSERVSGEDLETFFDGWLYSTEKPPATAEYGVPPKGPTSPDVAAAIERVHSATAMLAEAEGATSAR